MFDNLHSPVTEERFEKQSAKIKHFDQLLCRDTVLMKGKTGDNIQQAGKMERWKGGEDHTSPRDDLIFLTHPVIMSISTRCARTKYCDNCFTLHNHLKKE